MELTAEQRDIVDFPLRHGEILKVVAFAGTGKTTVLEQFARARPSLRLLYVAFNKFPHDFKYAPRVVCFYLVPVFKFFFCSHKEILVFCSSCFKNSAV